MQERSLGWKGLLVVWPPQAAESKGRQMGGKINILNEKFDFLRVTNFKLLSQIKVSAVNYFIFFYNFCKGLPLRLLATARMYIHSPKCGLISVNSFYKKKSKLKTTVQCNLSNALEKVLGKPVIFLLASELCFTRPYVNMP